MAHRVDIKFDRHRKNQGNHETLLLFIAYFKKMVAKRFAGELKFCLFPGCTFYSLWKGTVIRAFIQHHFSYPKDLSWQVRMVKLSYKSESTWGFHYSSVFAFHFHFVVLQAATKLQRLHLKHPLMKDLTIWFLKSNARTHPAFHWIQLSNHSLPNHFCNVFFIVWGNFRYQIWPRTSYYKF